MFNKIKKGFTIVELVIVIAVIAILAGVLIPTFSSVTKNAKKSAAQQQAKNGMESILALTGGSYPDGTDFLVSDSAKADGAKLDYWFAYAGNKLVEAEGDSNPGGKAISPYSDNNTYAVYFSSKCFEAANITTSDAYQVSFKLLNAATTDELTGFAFSGTATNGFYTLTKTVGEGTAAVTTTYKIYFSSDIEPTLVIVMGKNFS